MNAEPRNRPPLQREQLAPDQGSRRKTARAIAVSAVLVLAMLAGFGAWSQAQRKADAIAVLEARRNAIPTVRTMIAAEDANPRKITLPGNMAPFEVATLYARATGYIAVRNVDIGSKVRKGDVLAVIAAPDLDQQLAQAKAQLVQFEAAVQQAQANADLSHVTNQRTTNLVSKGWSSEQQGDQDRLTLAARVAALGVARANVTAQQAAVNRLAQLTGFEQITAPFDGVVTTRFIDVGSLVAADANTGTALFTLARTDLLRIQVYVPQSAYFGIKDGDRATVTVPELPDRVFDGEVSRNAQALAAGSRTLLAEVDVGNTSGALAAGLYCIVHLDIARSGPVIDIPSQAVIFNKDGLAAATVVDGKVELRKLVLEADNGADVEVRGGLRPGEQVILSPPANIVEGMRVNTIEASEAVAKK
ncbi:efflux RND transporter periplasmic adaptor subunit [Methylocapsa palsarum]|uniref:RND family efflux transporter, MFP subunit n=1 Tax=Methylocapsa palsarum TaxID=1612308 RepID=A0A1I3VR47_9HYPH|nr:efflux RND transporter periplasmic adaptor subunit [Methylocapsa palsarum]SFJ97403.1 RND family efflux transporter, MFP subunit [Methylocapsa palsarum]